MEQDEKEIVRETLQRYLEDEAPDQLEELAIVFDDVYEVVDRGVRIEDRPETSEGESGLAFDPGMVSGTVITTACWIAVAFFRAARSFIRDVRKSWAKKAIIRQWDELESELASQGVERELLAKLRNTMQRILAL